MPVITLTDEAKEYLLNYRWQGNIRQLKNITEQISIIETEKTINLETLKQYIPPLPALPMVIDNYFNEENIGSQKEIILTILNNKQQIAVLKNEIENLKEFVKQILSERNSEPIFINPQNNKNIIYSDTPKQEHVEEDEIIDNDYDEVDDSPMTLVEMEKKMILSALQRANGKRSIAAKELGISERTLYRKINDFDIEI